MPWTIMSLLAASNYRRWPEKVVVRKINKVWGLTRNPELLKQKACLYNGHLVSCKLGVNAGTEFVTIIGEKY